MSPRPRNKRNDRLPDYLTTQVVRGVTYYRYWHRGERRYVPFGRDKAAAVEAAKQVNAALAGSSALADKALNDTGPTISEGIARFRTEYLVPRKLAAKTAAEYGRMLDRVERDLGARAVLRINVQDVATFLDAMPTVASNRYRSLLVQFFRFCRAKYPLTHNPAEVTLIKQEEKARGRLTLEQYQAILEVATTPIRNAMELSLRSCQSRLEVSRMQFGDVKREVRDGREVQALHVHRQKTNAYLAIAIGPQLEAAIRACRDDVLSPYLVHQAIGANKRRRAKPLSPESISRGFARARDEAGLFDDLAPAERPTFHEIRSLGAKLFENAGKDAQQLLAHADRVTTEGYLEGHAPTPIRVESL